jgi:hypothetical protein
MGAAQINASIQGPALRTSATLTEVSGSECNRRSGNTAAIPIPRRRSLAHCIARADRTHRHSSNNNRSQTNAQQQNAERTIINTEMCFPKGRKGRPARNNKTNDQKCETVARRVGRRSVEDI